MSSLVFVKTHAKLHLLKFKNHRRNTNQYYQNDRSIECFLLQEEQSLRMLAVIILSLLTAAECLGIFRNALQSHNFQPTGSIHNY